MAVVSSLDLLKSRLATGQDRAPGATLGTLADSGACVGDLTRKVVELTRIDNLQAMFARYNPA